ncbi:glycosyltransferase [Laspinema olomoucense]|uniref:glycosyltransferase n=1 Tax=Laspinema olomoucense TaxID=3231600 RepID=UPI0021BAA59E|nr:glycosyltransferase [Laspinema sp. D3d]MCT7970694.1 glycosyltransferase [Laspinema sp. D3d]
MTQHILFYSDDHGLGGVAHYNHSILCGLAQKGYHVYSVQTQKNNPLIEQQQQLGINHFWLSYDTHKNFELTLQETEEPEKIFSRVKPDLIIFSDSWPLANFAPKKVADHLGIPYIVVVGFVAPYTAATSPVSFDELEHLYQEAKTVIAVSQENLRVLHEWFRLPRNKGEVIYYGRPIEYFKPPSAQNRDRLRQELQIPPEAVVCFTAARLDQFKGWNYQLQAIAQLKHSPQWENLYFVWAGTGELESPIKNALEQLQVTHHVKAIGRRWDIPDLLDMADIFVLPSDYEGMPLAVMEAMAKRLPIIASAVSGIPEELGKTGKLLPDPKTDAPGTVQELVNTLQQWAENPLLRKEIGLQCYHRACELFREDRMIDETVQTIQRVLMNKKDYISPGLKTVNLERYFPNRVMGNTDNCSWPYLRREIPHNWYVDKRQPVIGFLNPDEAHILYNSALKFKGKKGLEIGCWLGWSACHIASAGVELDVVDPLLSRPEIYESVTQSLAAAGVRDRINLLPGYSPQQVEELGAKQQQKWSLIFIDGNHEGDGPLQDAIACEKLAAEDALILFHDLASPDVARGLDYFKQKGWNTLVYQTMQIMAVAWRGKVQPVYHKPDPKINWPLPTHLQGYAVSGITTETTDTTEFQEILAAVRPYTLLSEARLFSLYSRAKHICQADIPGNFVECGAYKGGSTALLAAVIKRYSSRSRLLYAFDTFTGMPDPTAVDRHEGIPANLTGLGAGTLQAPLDENLEVICRTLGVSQLVVPVPGLFEQTLPEYESTIGAVAFLHADADWYESTLTIFNTLYNRIVPKGIIQIDDYGFWEGCKQAINDFQTAGGMTFPLQIIDETGVWFCKEDVRELSAKPLNPLDPESYYHQIPEPKKKGAVSSSPQIEAEIIHRLQQLGIQVEDYEIDISEYERYFQSGNYLQEFSEYYAFNRVEKSLEHYVAAKLLQLSNRDIYIDIGSEKSPVPEIYRRLFGLQTYRQDLSYPPGINGDRIGGNAAQMPVPDSFATKMALHCAFEHFEGDADIGFVREVARVLKPGGAVCILPLYLAKDYAIQTDPVTAISTGGVNFELDAVIYCASGWQNRHGRFYDPEHLVQRICQNLNGLTLKIYRIKNAQGVDSSCYLRFAAVLEKPPVKQVLNLPSFAPETQTHSLSKSSDKKVLIFFPHNPYPPKTGAHQRCMEMVNALKGLGYEITLFSSTLFSDIPWDIKSIQGLEENMGIQVEVYPGTEGDRQYSNEISNRNPGQFNADYYTPPGLRERFRQRFQALKPQIVLVNYSLWGRLVQGDEFKSAVRIIDAIDLFTLNLQMGQAFRRYLHQNPLVPKQIDAQVLREDFYSQLQLKALPEEYAIFDLYDYTLAISSQEAESIQQNTQQTQVEYVPMTFETETLPNTYAGFPLLAIGNNPFNVQGYLYFAAKVLPIVRQQSPDFTLKVLGKGCKNLAPVPGIDLVGFIEEIKPLYAESRFAICPLIGGTGQQVKIVEAMAYGVPVIALENVAKSSPIEHGVNGLIAKNAEEFAKYTLELWRNPERCRELGQAARQTIAHQFSPQILAERMKELTHRRPVELSTQKITSIIDGVFYQINNTGIARVWTSLLQEWVKTGFAKQLLFLDRAGTAPRIPGIKYLCIQGYDYNNTEADRRLLQDICDEESADIFISTYYTTPLSTPSVFMAYDMIPERYPTALNSPMWREKHHGIRHGSAYITISEQTARDLVKFFPEIPGDRVTVAHCGIHPEFAPTPPGEINSFKSKYNISKPYFLWIGSRSNINSYKNAILFFQAFAKLPSRREFQILCVGGIATLEAEFQPYVIDTQIHLLHLSDRELRLAYSGAVALIYPSKYEGFGLPILEAMACGCPVITCPNGAIPEVAGQSVIYVNDNDIDGLVNAMQEIQKPQVRNPLIAAGFQRTNQFSWAKMAEIVRSTLIATAQNPPKRAIATPISPTPVEPPTLTDLQQTRQQLAQQWLNTPEEQLQFAYLGQLGTAHKALLESGVKHHPITPSEQALIRKLSVGIAQGFDAPTALQSFIAATLYCYPHHLPIPYKNAPIPKWFAQDYLKFMFASPTLFHETGEVEQYYRYFQGWLEYVHQKIFSNPDSALWQSVAEFFTQGNANFAPLYFTLANLKSVYSQRGEIIELALKNRGFEVDYVFPTRSPNRPKIRLGILRDHFNPATETFATLPVFEHLDRDRFEIVLYASWANGSQLEWYCQSRADRLVKLPENLLAQVQTLRNEDLDILFIGTNITELNKPLTALAQHRLARVQVTSIASPVTTGIRNIDYYIAGNLTAPTTTSSEQYREKLVNIEGSGLCFRFPLPEPASTVNPTRASWGATEETLVFMSGANFYKILPELTETWAKILAAVPHSILVLYPFGPACNSSYPALPFLERIHRIFANHGVDKRRLILINTLPSPADIKECVKLADVYLDSYPYSGATSLLDPLQLGIPAIAWEGSSLRSRQASALLREIHLADLIAQDEPGYIQLAIKLATNPQLRHHYRQQIQQKMQQNPPFLDSAVYGQKMGNLFEQLFQKGQTSGAMASAISTPTPATPVSVSQEFLNRLIGCANLYYIDPSDESIHRELLQLRREFAELWLQIPSDRLRECYTYELGKAHQSVLNSGIQNEPLPATEQTFVQELMDKLTSGLNAPLGMNAVLALLLYQQRDRLPLSSQTLPDWVNV